MRIAAMVPFGVHTQKANNLETDEHAVSRLFWYGAYHISACAYSKDAVHCIQKYVLHKKWCINKSWVEHLFHDPLENEPLAA